MDQKKLSNGIGKGLSVLNGITGIAGNAISASKIADTSAYDNIITSLDDIGNQQYDSFEQIQNGMNRVNSFQQDFDLEKIRGMNDAQKAGSILSSTLAGASAGLTFAPPWGALAGAVVGLGAGVGGVLAGDKAAKVEQSRLRNDMKLAQLSATRGIESSAENLLTDNHRNEIANASAQGGKIQRQLSLQEFIGKKINNSPRRAEAIRSAIVTRQMCDGGLRVRIKR